MGTLNEGDIAGGLNALAARQDALAAAWIALAITVCRANPRAQGKIEQLALQWAVRRAQALEEAGLATPAAHMHTQLEVLLQAIRVELHADAKKKK